MSEKNRQDFVFVLTRDQILACAWELGIADEQLTDEAMGLVKNRLEAEFRRWPEIVKEVLSRAARCPLGLACFPSCSWWKEGRCIFPGSPK
jgi:hypothetical protein